MVKLDFYWETNEEWWHLENDVPVLNADAPKEAKESYEHYLYQIDDIDRRTGRWLYIPKSLEGWEHFRNDIKYCSDDLPSYYTDEYITIVKISYDEFVFLRNHEIDDFMEGEFPDGPVGKMSPAYVEECRKLVEPYKNSVSQFYAALLEAEKYGTDIQYLEENIL